MKFQYIIYLALIIGFTGCAKDNYDAPGSFLSGRIMYNGEPINVEHNQVGFQLWETSYSIKTHIQVNVAQDGSFSQALFNGEYKLIIVNQGPFRNKVQDATGSDTILVKVNGTQSLDIEVTPYYIIKSPQIAISGSNVNATFGLEKVINDANAKNIEKVFLYVNKTQFVSGGNNIKAAEIAGDAITDPNSVSLSLDLPSISQNYVYARVGVKIKDVEDMLFSPVQKIDK